MNVLNLGIAETFFNAVANGVQNSTAFALPTPAIQLTWQTSFGTAPASVTLQLQTSNDNITWSTVDTSTSTAGESRTINTSANFIRIRENAVSGGSTTTVLVTCKTGFIAGPSLDFSGSVSIGGNLSVVGSLVADGLSYPTTDGTNGQVLTTDGSGHLSFTTVSGGGTPGGLTTQVQFNDGGSFGGESALAWEKATDQLRIQTVFTPALVQSTPALRIGSSGVGNGPIISLEGSLEVNSNPEIDMYASNGSMAVPTALSSQDTILAFEGFAYDGTNFIESVRIIGTAFGSISTGVVPSKLEMYVANSSGVVSHRMQLFPDSVSLNGAATTFDLDDATVGAATVTGDLLVTGNYKSSDGTSGISAGPFTTITAITVKNGLVTALTGS